MGREEKEKEEKEKGKGKEDRGKEKVVEKQTESKLILVRNKETGAIAPVSLLLLCCPSASAAETIDYFPMGVERLVFRVSTWA